MSNYYKKKREVSAKSISKIKIEKSTNNINGYNFVFAQYKMSLKFGEIQRNKKEFHR